MKKKELKKLLAATEKLAEDRMNRILKLNAQTKDLNDSLQRTNENFDQLCKDNKEQARDILELTRQHNSKTKYIKELREENEKLAKENNDLRARFQKEWEGKESVELRKTCAYIQECYEIKEAEVIQYKEEVKELKSKLAVKTVSEWVEDAKQIDELKRDVQQKAAQIKNQRDLIEKYQRDIEQFRQWKKEAVAVRIEHYEFKLQGQVEEIEELKIVIKARDEKIEKVKGQLGSLDEENERLKKELEYWKDFAR